MLGIDYWSNIIELSVITHFNISVSLISKDGIACGKIGGGIGSQTSHNWWDLVFNISANTPLTMLIESTSMTPTRSWMSLRLQTPDPLHHPEVAVSRGTLVTMTRNRRRPHPRRSSRIPVTTSTDQWLSLSRGGTIEEIQMNQGMYHNVSLSNVLFI